MERIDTTAVVETPERVAFRFRVAGPAARGVAWGLDLVVQGLALGVVVGIAVAAGVTVDPGLAMGTLAILAFVLTWFYAALFEVGWSGRTPGKRVLGLRVVHGDGAPVTPRGALLRNLARAVDGLPVLYAIGALVSVADPRLRRVGDWIADTVVIVEGDVALLGDVPISPPISLEEGRSLPAKVALTTRERRAIEALLRRRDRLSPARMEALAALLAPALAARTGVEAPTALRVLTLAYARATGRDA